MMKSLVCKDICAQVLESLSSIARKSEKNNSWQAFFEGYQAIHSKDEIHIILILDGETGGAETAGSIIGSPDIKDSSFERSGFSIRAIPSTDLRAKSSAEALLSADAIVYCFGPDSRIVSSLPDGFVSTFRNPAYQGKIVFAIEGFDRLFEGSKDTVGDYYDYISDWEELFDALQQDFSEKLFVFSSAVEEAERLAECVDNISAVRDKCLDESAYLESFITDSLEKLQRKRPDDQIRQEQVKKSELKELIAAESSRTCKNLGEILSAAQIKLEKRFSSKKRKARNIIMKAEDEIDNAVEQALREYHSAQKHIWESPMSDSKL